MTSLDPEELAAIDGLLQDRQNLPRHHEIVRAGDSSAKLHILLDGWAIRYKILTSGVRQVVALVLPGDPCDLDGILVNRQDSSVATISAATIATVPRDALLGIGRTYPRLADMLLWLTTLDNAMMSERVASLVKRSAQESVAHLFCELALRLATVGMQKGNSFPMLLTQELIGDTLGLTPVHVNRVLQGLRSDGLIELREQVLTITDWQGLKAIAGFEASYLHLSGMRELDDQHAMAGRP
jgi:CRP-like cAMP-binding protein